MSELLYRTEGIINRLICATLKLLAGILPMPRPVLFNGPGASTTLCESIAAQGYRRVLIVSDEVLIKLGILEGILSTLAEQNVQYYIYDQVLPDPTDLQAENGLLLQQQNQCDAVLAVGGGSPIDVGKAIAARATNPRRSLKKLAGYFKLRSAPLPFFAIPTTAGTGSEATIGAVMSDTESHHKRMIIDPRLMPRMAALDSQLMHTLPAKITAATAMDALTHAIEAYISRNASEETDAFSRAAVCSIMQNLPEVMLNGENLQARQQLALASHYAGLALTKASLGYVHAIAHNLGAFYGVSHGEANALVLPHVLEFSKPVIYSRLAQLALVAGLTTRKTPEKQACEIFIQHIRQLLIQCDINGEQLPIKSSDIRPIARLAIKEASYNYPVPRFMRQKQCESILFHLSQAG